MAQPAKGSGPHPRGTRLEVLALTVTEIREGDPLSGIRLGVGRMAEDRWVLFAGEHREMAFLADLVDAGEEPLVDVEPWQIIARLLPTGHGTRAAS